MKILNTEIIVSKIAKPDISETRNLKPGVLDAQVLKSDTRETRE